MRSLLLGCENGIYLASIHLEMVFEICGRVDENGLVFSNVFVILGVEGLRVGVIVDVDGGV